MLTPKEKANLILDSIDLETNWNLLTYDIKSMGLLLAKEVIEVIDPTNHNGELLKYWQEVREELEKL